MNLLSIKHKFETIFNSKPIWVKSPGRINLIGEHTDYNEGFVFPAAINKEIIFAVAKNEKNKYRFFALDLDAYFEIDVDDLRKSDVNWANYLLGVLDQFKKENHTISGIDCVFGGNIPIGAGLSSSAALENGFAFALNILFDIGIDKIKLVHMSQSAEHEYAGVKCGIMDQYASMFGLKNHAILLDCKDLSSEYLKIDLSKYIIILVDTKVSHNLASSEYNQRRKECEKGVDILKKFNGNIHSLRDVSSDLLEKHKKELDSTVYKRCKYVINENNRVLESKKALKDNDLKAFGNLLFESHKGLKEEYEVSCSELDFLVDTAKSSGFVIGSRMMGGGFGGCTINLVKIENTQDFEELILSEYKKKTNIDPDIIKVKITSGTNLMDI